jgi:hypothetical protein
LVPHVGGTTQHIVNTFIPNMVTNPGEEPHKIKKIKK